MLENIELGRVLSKADFKEAETALRTDLLNLQEALRESGFTALLVIEGVDNASKASLVNRLGEWLDARRVDFVAFGPKSDEEQSRPRFWRYWRHLPARGRIGLFANSWYTGSLVEQALGRRSSEEVRPHYQRITQFEEMLSRDRHIVLKFWLHKSSSEQAGWLRKVGENPDRCWQVTEEDLALLDAHDKLVTAAEQAIRLTDIPEAPWMLVEASDERYCHATVARTLIDCIQSRILTEDRSPAAGAHPATIASKTSVLQTLDMGRKLKRSAYREQYKRLGRRLELLNWQVQQQGRSTVLVFEGWDAAGKGGTIRRLTPHIDIRNSRVIQVAAPTDEEAAHHYLWRFWRHLPRAGHLTIYDRSWYGRVLVERVEGFASVAEWRRAYTEINEFEQQLVDGGIILLKFWMHITPEEQLARFRAREETPYKQYKITEEDWRNRERWTEYESAVQDMVVRTSHTHAPWHLVPANDKKFARIQVLETLCNTLESELAVIPPEAT